MTSRKELFGGAISIELPNLIDASTIRQVPDTQEVFLSTSSDDSYIIEILQRVEPDDLKEAAKFHFDALAHDNNAVSSTITSIEVPSPSNTSVVSSSPSPTLLDGIQWVAKYNRSTPDKVQILLAVYRVEDKGVDIVFSANLPQGGVSVNGSASSELKDSFNRAAQTLKIVDFGLFA